MERALRPILPLLLLLTACGHRHEQMLQQLTELERQNRADSVMHNDTLALTQTSSPAVSIAKSRVNQKLFKEKSAATLKFNLKRAV